MGKSFVDAGGAIVEILASKLGAAPMRSDLDAWIAGPGLPVTSVKDPDNLPLQSLTALERREITYVVDLRTMKIVDKIYGSIVGIGDSSAKTGMNEALTLLAGARD